MIITEANLRKIVRDTLLYELFDDKGKQAETSYLSSELSSKLLMGSSPLRRAIDRVDSDIKREEVYVYLRPAKMRTASDREVACAIKNLMSELDLSYRWLLNPCRYDEEAQRDVILIAPAP